MGSNGLIIQVIELFEHRLGGNMLLKLLQFPAIHVRIEPQMIGYRGDQGDDLCHLVFRKETHLKVEIGMLPVGVGHAVLPDEDEGRQKDCLNRSYRAENSETWIPPGN
jgi:hypothetical protein